MEIIDAGWALAALLVAGIVAAIVATIHAVVTDGYRQVPRRAR